MNNASHPLQILNTPGGVRFVLQGEPTGQPAPALFVFATDAETSLTQADFNEVGHRLLGEGVLGISLTLPCHGEDQRPDEPFGLDGWRTRLENNEPMIQEFTARVSEVLDHLIQEGYVDEQRVAVCGTSRGGFIALHFTASEPRVKCVAAFAPVTDLMALREFEGLERHAAVAATNLLKRKEELTGRSIFITIGNADLRVDTDRAITLARAVTKLSTDPEKIVDIELHVTPSIDHYIADSAHRVAAEWIAERLAKTS